MNRSALYENAILAFVSGPGGGINLIIPLYLSHLGYPVTVIGVMLALASVSTLLSRLPSAALYRPERARFLIIATLVGGAISFAALPLMPELVSFSVALVVNRVCFGLATTLFLARYLDLMAQGTDRRRAMGFYSGTQALGYTSSNFLIGFLSDAVSDTAAWLYGAVFAVIAIIMLLGARDAPRHTAEQQAAALQARPRSVRAWLREATDPGLLSVLNGAAVINVFHNTLVSFFPVYAVSIGLGATQIGIARSVYSGINAVARPIAGIAMARLSVRQITYGGITSLGLLMLAIPYVQIFPLFMVLFIGAAIARSILVVANAIALAENVDETRVSRGVATSAYSAAPDVANIAAPVVAGFVASLVTVGAMFAIVGVGSLAGYAAFELILARRRATTAPVAVGVGPTGLST